ALTGDAEHRALAEGALRTTAVAGRSGGGNRCHGLAGNGDVLLEGSQALGEPRWLAQAEGVAGLIALPAPPAPGGLGWPVESPERDTPDYMVGSAGVGAFLLRLAAPGLAHPLMLPLKRPHRGRRQTAPRGASQRA